MAKPQPRLIEPAELQTLARDVIAKARFPFMATIDGLEPRVRPVSPVRVDGFTVFIANLKSYHKTAELAANAHVELCYMDPAHDHIRIAGLAEIVTDPKVLLEIWEANPLLRQYLGHVDNPELIIYKVVPQRVRYMQEWALEYYEVPLG